MSDRTCSFDGCEAPVRCRGWCAIHYERWRKHGDPSVDLKHIYQGRACSIDGCEARAVTRGWCRKHYCRWQHRGGDPAQNLSSMGPPKRPVEERFWEKVDRSSDGCWEWTAALDSSGYGHFTTSGQNGSRKNHPASRFAWMLTNGPIPDGLLVCHHCDNRRCCRPDHLFLGTALDNTRDGVRKGRITGPAFKTHCKHGHELAGSNLYVEPSTGKRRCRTCETARRRAKRRAA